MRLGEVLSKPISEDFVRIEDFIKGKVLSLGKIRKIKAGTVARTYFCKNCNLPITFSPVEDLRCVMLNERLISINAALKCNGCNEMLPIWFLLESEEPFNSSTYHKVRLLLAVEKLNDNVTYNSENYGEFTEFLEKAEISFRNGLGAAAIVYLRKIFEGITHQIAKIEGVEIRKQNGSLKPFKEILEKVDERHPIIPREFSENGYRLFRELSDIVHSDNIENEEIGLKKFTALKRLVIGILDNVKNNNEIMVAIGSLNWNGEGDDNE